MSVWGPIEADCFSRMEVRVSRRWLRMDDFFSGWDVRRSDRDRAEEYYDF
jgi:hypothetical protein